MNGGQTIPNPASRSLKLDGIFVAAQIGNGIVKCPAQPARMHRFYCNECFSVIFFIKAKVCNARGCHRHAAEVHPGLVFMTWGAGWSGGGASMYPIS